jgi:hypothetical protein
MPRYCLLGHVDASRLDEYREAHGAVWPELLEALRDAGWRNYSLFLRNDGLCGRTGEGGAHRTQYALAGNYVQTIRERRRSRRSVGDHPGGLQPRRAASGIWPLTTEMS